MYGSEVFCNVQEKAELWEAGVGIEGQRWVGTSVVREGWRVATRCVSEKRLLSGEVVARTGCWQDIIRWTAGDEFNVENHLERTTWNGPRRHPFTSLLAPDDSSAGRQWSHLSTIAVPFTYPHSIAPCTGGHSTPPSITSSFSHSATTTSFPSTLTHPTPSRAPRSPPLTPMTPCSAVVLLVGG